MWRGGNRKRSSKGEVFLSRSPRETQEIGAAIGETLASTALLCLWGDLGAGKTTLIQGLASALTALPKEEINSPTFTYLNVYEGKGRTIYHFDCYRLKGAEEFLERGLDDYFSQLCLVEWPERILSILPSFATHLRIETLSEEARRVTYEKNSL